MLLSTSGGHGDLLNRPILASCKFSFLTGSPSITLVQTMNKCHGGVTLAVPFRSLHDFLESLSTGFSACFFFRYVTFSTKDSRRPLMVKSLFPSRDLSSSSSIPSRKKTKRNKKRTNMFKNYTEGKQFSGFAIFSAHSLKQCYHAWNTWGNQVKWSFPLAFTGKIHSLLSCYAFSFPPVFARLELSAVSTK